MSQTDVQDHETAVPPSPPVEPEVTEPPAPPASAELSETPLEPGDGTPEEQSQRGISRRFAKLSARISILDEENKLLRERLRGGIEPPKPPSAAPAPQAKPNPAEYDGSEGKTLGDYEDARDAWLLEEAKRLVREENQKADQARKQQSEAEVMAGEWSEREEAAKTKHADYEEAVDSIMNQEGTGILDTLRGPSKATVADMLPHSEFGPEILYHFAKNPDELERICNLSPRQAILALGRIEARLAPQESGGEPPPQPRVPKPPTPIRKVSGKDDGELRDDLTPEEWRKRYSKKMERKE